MPSHGFKSLGYDPKLQDHKSVEVSIEFKQGSKCIFLCIKRSLLSQELLVEGTNLTTG